MEVDGANNNTQKFRLGMHGVGVWREEMEVGSPFTNGIVSNWDALEALWTYTLTDQMRLNTEDHPMMLTEPSFNTNDAREKMVELMFEKYKVPGMGLSWWLNLPLLYSLSQHYDVFSLFICIQRSSLQRMPFLAPSQWPGRPLLWSTLGMKTQ